jgi:multiple sugar transport system permease protein
VGIFPLLFAVWNSLHQFILPKVKSQGSILGIWPLFDAPFICFGNYTALLTDQSFREALLRTLLFLVINLPIQLGLGMAIALLLHRPGNEFLKKIDRIALVIPLATTFAVVGLMGRLMFNRDFGVLNYFWSLIFGEKVDWLADPNLAFISISIMEDCQSYRRGASVFSYRSQLETSGYTLGTDPDLPHLQRADRCLDLC